MSTNKEKLCIDYPSKNFKEEVYSKDTYQFKFLKNIGIITLNT